MGKGATEEGSSRDGLRCVTNDQDHNQDLLVRAQRETTDLCSAEGFATLRVVHFLFRRDQALQPEGFVLPAIHLVHRLQRHELSLCGRSLLISGPRFMLALRKTDFVGTKHPVRASEDVFRIGSDWMREQWHAAHRGNSALWRFSIPAW